MSWAHISPAHWAGFATHSQPYLQAALVEDVAAQCCVQIVRILTQANWTAVILSVKFIITIINIIIITCIRPDVKLFH